MSAGLFVDTSDLYHRVRRKFNGAKLCYEAYYSSVEAIDPSFAYVMQSENEASGFISCLKMIGFDVCFKRPRLLQIADRTIKQCDWKVQLTIDVVETLPGLDTVFLGVSNPDYIPLVQWVKDQGVKVVILACGVPKSLYRVADSVIEIDESFLEASDA